MLNLKSFLLKQKKKLDLNIIKKYFYTDNLEGLYKYLDSSESNSSHAFIETRLNTLKYDMKKLSDREIGEKKLDLQVDFVEEILDATRINKQQGQGLKILTPK